MLLKPNQTVTVKRDGLSRPASLGGHVDYVQAAIASVAFFAQVHQKLNLFHTIILIIQSLEKE